MHLEEGKKYIYTYTEKKIARKILQYIKRISTFQFANCLYTFLQYFFATMSSGLLISKS